MKYLSLLFVAASLFGAEVNVQKDSGANTITGPLVIGSGKSVTVASGGSLILQSGSTFTPLAGTVPWSALTGQPTTIAGYGITDPIVLTSGSYSNPGWLTSLDAGKLTLGTLAVARLPAFAGGDVISSAGSAVLTLGTSGVTASTYGSGSAIPVITVDAKGRATTITTTAITPLWSNITGTPTSAAGYAIVNGANIDAWGAKAIPSGTVADLSSAQTFTNKISYNGLTHNPQAVGFTISGGTTSKTLTVPLDATVSGTNTGDQTITLTGDATGSGTGSFGVTVTRLNGVALGGLATGILKNTTTTGVPTIAAGGTDYEFPITFSTGLTRSTNTVTVNPVQNITKISGLTSNGFVKTSGGDGTLGIDGSTYLTANQNITISGDVTGSGTTAITATLTNIPTNTAAAGSILHTNIAAPGTPASGKTSVYVDSTSKNIAAKNDAGTVNHGIQSRTATGSNWIRAINDDGSTTISQPAFSDISSTLGSTQFPVLAGDVNSAGGTLTTTVVKVNGVAYGTSPATSTVPVVTSTNTVTYEAVPNAALANSAITIQGSSISLGGSTLSTSSSPQFGHVGLGAAADGTAQILNETDGLGTTSTDSIIIQNATAAAAGSQQWTGRIRYRGQGWKSNSTAASQPVDVFTELRTVQGTSAPSGLFAWSGQINGGGYADLMTLSTTGNLTTTGAIVGSNLSLGGTFTTSAAVNISGAGTVTLSGSPTLGNWFDQSVKTTDIPVFAGVNGSSSFDIRTGGTSRILIDSSGRLSIGGTQGPFNAKQVITMDGSAVNGIRFNDTYSTAGSTEHLGFNRNGSTVGSVTTTLTATTYNTSSDKRMKSNFHAIVGAGSIIDSINVGSFTWFNGDNGYGVLAQDLAKVVPEAVHKGDSVAPNMNAPGFQAWGVDYSKLVPYLISETQALRLRVATLEARLTALENK